MNRVVMGIDPGLTRCGIGCVRGDGASVYYLAVGVLETDPQVPIEERLYLLDADIRKALDTYSPQIIAIERVFAGIRNLNTVMGIAYLTGIILKEAYIRKIKTVFYTPSEVKSFLTGYGSAQKAQVASMVKRILGVQELPSVADATDALAIAVCACSKTRLAGIRAANFSHGSINT